LVCQPSYCTGRGRWTDSFAWHCSTPPGVRLMRHHARRGAVVVHRLTVCTVQDNVPGPGVLMGMYNVQCTGRRTTYCALHPCHPLLLLCCITVQDNGAFQRCFPTVLRPLVPSSPRPYASPQSSCSSVEACNVCWVGAFFAYLDTVLRKFY
jgi:hypothetical protein